MKDRSMYHRLMKQSEKGKERKKRNSKSDNSQTEEQKKDTKGIGDKLRRGHGGDGQRQGEPKYKDNVRFNTSLKREKN